ncbi:MAG: cobyric acid synthase [Chloroflexi bacterium]|nr:cobyric acid synthase [Chloroflexota bacterium]
MVQGTSSSVGKSVLCAALCRIFARAGLTVAPFKAQNMSNNAFVTPDGGEIGRAQAVQALAAGVTPSVDMNPVLLKPEGDRGSQVIVHGQVAGRLAARDYLERKRWLWTPIRESLARLRAAYDVVVIEGAGSPAEINLRAGDVVNMAIAHAAEAPVLLVGDIDRGGVFAALLGTLDLLEPGDRQRVAATIVNRFRGERALLEPGLEELRTRSGLPVLGVIPYIQRLNVAEEDAATIQTAGASGTCEQTSTVVVAAIRYPGVSNFDDLDALTRGGAHVRWVDRPDRLGRPDLVVLPGSKNTMSDLLFLEQSGLGGATVEAADRGVPLLGLCGGYQMLGEWVQDPGLVESSVSRMPGLGLLPLVTTLAAEKTTRQVRGHVLAGRGLFAQAAGVSIEGYEIHLGETTGPGAPLLELSIDGSARPEGRSARSGWICGTYVHGLLDAPEIAAIVVRNLARRRGLTPPPALREQGDPLDRLADVVSTSLELPLLWRIVGLPTASLARATRPGSLPGSPQYRE